MATSRRSKNWRLLPAVTLAAGLGLLQPAPAPAADAVSIYDTLAARKDHTVLFVATAEAKETAALRGRGPYTLFAPTDAAFKKLDDATIKKIATDKPTVQKLLKAHLVSGNLTTADLRKLDGKELRTLGGTALKVEVTKDGIRVSGAKLVGADIICSNGVIHATDGVLLKE